MLSTKAYQCFLQNLSDEEIITSRIYEQLYYRNVTKHASVLFYSGFLSVALCYYALTAEVVLCNRQMTNIVVSKMVQWLTDHLENVTATEDTFVSLADDLSAFKVTGFEEKLRAIINNLPADEEVYYIGVMKSVKRFFGPDYIVHVNLPPWSAKQSVSIIATPKNRWKNAVILEYRLANDSREQDVLFRNDVEHMNSPDCDIDHELYPHVEQILKIVVMFFRKDFQMQYRIDRNETESEKLASRRKAAITTTVKPKAAITTVKPKKAEASTAIKAKAKPKAKLKTATTVTTTSNKRRSAKQTTKAETSS